MTKLTNDSPKAETDPVAVPSLGLVDRAAQWMRQRFRRGLIPAVPLTIILACLVGIAAGYGSVAFSLLIETVTHFTVEMACRLALENRFWLLAVGVWPALGLLAVSWFTRRFAPEAQGHGVPEVIAAVARHDGIIRPRVAIVKILASGLCIGTGGSIGREGPIVQIGAAVGSVASQMFRLSARHTKVLVAAGSAAGISATFHAPIAGVMFASEIILGNFAVESLTPVVIAAVLADVIQVQVGEHGWNPAFPQLNHSYEGSWSQLPTFLILGLVCGLAAVSFTKLVYIVEDVTAKRIKTWTWRAVTCGLLLGVTGVLYPMTPPSVSESDRMRLEEGDVDLPPLYGVGYPVVSHSLHLLNDVKAPVETLQARNPRHNLMASDESKSVRLSVHDMLRQLWWLLPLALLKPLATSVTLGGGGSGGIFAPSLYIGATTGACFGLACNLLLGPAWCAHPGLYAVVGMGAVVAGTTHGILSAILIVYEMTYNYQIILPIMVAAGLASLVARLIDPEDIYQKKLSRRGEAIARSHDMHRLEHIKVRDVMIRNFPTVLNTDNVTDIIAVARANAHIESLPVMNESRQLVGIIRPEDLHRVLDSEISIHLLNADDIALATHISVSPDANLLEALRDFGTRDVETLPVETNGKDGRKFVGLLQRSDVMRRYREEMLRIG